MIEGLDAVCVFTLCGREGVFVKNEFDAEVVRFPGVVIFGE